jgi:hypothetical protein
MEREGIPFIPEIKGRLRSNFIRVPEAICDCTGIRIMGKLIKSLLFSTDVAIIRNTNADAVIAVYPFTPQPIITDAIILASDIPVFCGVGGGLTTGKRLVSLALHAEMQGALGVVVNKPTPNKLIGKLKKTIDIPVIVTVVSPEDDIRGRIEAGVDILNVSGAAKTPEIIRHIREIHPTIPIIATGGSSNNSIKATVAAGANAVTYTPPTTGQLFAKIMEDYRTGKPYSGSSKE